MNTEINNIDTYIHRFPKETQDLLQQIRTTIKEAAPEAEEKISYKMPTFYLHGNLLHFAAYKNHIGFYPMPSGIKAFAKEFSKYKTAKGSVQFPIDESIPHELISKVVKFRVTQNTEKAQGKKTLRTCKNGHRYYKSSDCPTCPVCEDERKPQHGFMAKLSAPARRALENNGIFTLQQLSEFSAKEILQFHGMGKSSIPKLREGLVKEGLEFRK